MVFGAFRGSYVFVVSLRQPIVARSCIRFADNCCSENMLEFTLHTHHTEALQASQLLLLFALPASLKNPECHLITELCTAILNA